MAGGPTTAADASGPWASSLPSSARPSPPACYSAARTTPPRVPARTGAVPTNAHPRLCGHRQALAAGGAGGEVVLDRPSTAPSTPLGRACTPSRHPGAEANRCTMRCGRECGYCSPPTWEGRRPLSLLSSSIAPARRKPVPACAGSPAGAHVPPWSSASSRPWGSPPHRGGAAKAPRGTSQTTRWSGLSLGPDLGFIGQMTTRQLGPPTTGFSHRRAERDQRTTWDWPPSMTKVAPVIHAARSEARKATSSPTCPGWPGPPSGTSPTTA